MTNGKLTVCAICGAGLLLAAQISGMLIAYGITAAVKKRHCHCCCLITEEAEGSGNDGEHS